MGLEYLTTEQMPERQERLGHELKRQPSWVLRDGLLEKEFGSSDREMRIVDLGSGSGETERQLLGLGFKNISSVDIYDFMDFPGKETSAIKFVKADLSKDALDFSDATADVVLALQILEHLENPWHCAREILRIAKPGATIFVSIPDASSFVNRLKYLFTSDIPTYGLKNNHIALFTKALFWKLWRESVTLKTVYRSEAYVKVFGRKLRFDGNSWIGRLFSRKIAYCLIRR
ncbi:MAG: methyltransferase domain-containing protein [Patescibacteria group bacterium]|nr:methyltransferase domain-containing protein [Patescibacteria group bacterium]